MIKRIIVIILLITLQACFEQATKSDGGSTDPNIIGNNTSSNTSQSSASNSQFVIPDLFITEWDADYDRVDLKSYTLSEYYLSKTEVTQSLFEQTIGYNPSLVKGETLPVNSVSWYEAVLFCNALSKSYGLDTLYQYQKPSSTSNYLQNVVVDTLKTGIRLPTEIEWEAAVLANHETVYPWGDGLQLLGNYAVSILSSNLNSELANVKSLDANAFGLFDVTGNVAEMLNDWYIEPIPFEDTVDPMGPTTGTRKTVKGGSWQSSATDLTVQARSSVLPDYTSDLIGFRVALIKR